MMYSLNTSQRDFFSKHRFIEFEDLLSETEAAVLLKQIEAEIGKRLPSPLAEKSPRELYLASRNLWRTNGEIKRLLFKKQIHQLASLLFQKKEIRLAFDQALLTRGVLGPIFPKNFTLQEASSFQNMVGGVMINLGLPHEASLFALPKKAGSAIFFAADLIIPFDKFTALKDLNLLLIGYCSKNSVYIEEKNDPHGHSLKREGYAYGDHLRDETNPLFFS